MTTKLSDIDFMMMDLHRPLTNAEVEAINPQALVDHTAGQDTGSEEEGVGERCHACFGAMPCAAHANVEPLNIITSNDVDPVRILAGAHNRGLEIVVVVGMTKDGNEYFASSAADAAESSWLLQRGIHKLNKIVDGDDESENLEPGRPAS
jgi:hypothetical protein